MFLGNARQLRFAFSAWVMAFFVYRATANILKITGTAEGLRRFLQEEAGWSLFFWALAGIALWFFFAKRRRQQRRGQQ